MHSPPQNEPTFLHPTLRGTTSTPGARWLDLRAVSQLEQGLWIAALLLWTLYAAYFAQLSSFPFQDYPNHLARASILADLIFHGGQRFGAAYAFHFTIAPYALHDAVLTALVAALGVDGGGAVFMIMVLLSLPCALIFYMRANQLAPRAELFVLLISLYLATDWFFLMGFMAFRFALAFIVASMALADLLRARWRRPLFAWYVATLVAGYLTHLTSLVFFAPVLAVSGSAAFGVPHYHRAPGSPVMGSRSHIAGATFCLHRDPSRRRQPGPLRLLLGYGIRQAASPELGVRAL